MLLLWEKNLKKHCKAFKDNFHLLHLQFVIINDFEEEEQVKKKTIEIEKEVEQPIERRFFDIKFDFPNIHVIPTKAQSKYMMRHKRKENVEEGNSHAKVTWKWTPIETKEIQKMLYWIQMGSKEQQWVERANLGRLFVVH